VTSDLQFWVKADDGVYTDTGSTSATDTNQVQSWHDQSLIGNHLNQPATAQPVFNTQGVNFNPTVAFTSDSLPVDRNLDGTSDDAIM
jgi:hypothetical protein